MSLVNDFFGFIKRGSSPRTTRMLEASMGTAGFNVIGTGETVSGKFVAIYIDEEAECSAVSALNDNLPSLTRTAGMVILGPFTEVTVVTGSVLAYLGDN